jgi:predicted transposase YdaD
MDTDRTLKLLALRFPDTYARWLLEEPVTVQEALATELPAGSRQADVVFRAEDSKGQPFVLHAEFQAQRPTTPMAERMLEYRTRLRRLHELPVRSVVVYLTKYAWAGDTGEWHEVWPGGELLFRYRVIRSWEIPPDALLSTGEVGLYPLVGLTALPEERLGEVVNYIRKVEDTSLQQDLLAGFALLGRFRHSRSVLEALIRKEEIMESPLAKEIYQEGLEQGLEKGQLRGALESLRSSVLTFTVARFAPSREATEEIEDILATIDNTAILQMLVADVARAETLEEFLVSLRRIAGG